MADTNTAGVAGRIWLYSCLGIVQASFAGFQILSQVALDNGVNVVIFNLYKSITALLVLVPAAICFERNNQPPLTRKMLLHLFALAAIGLVSSQTLFLVGMSLTSAAFASTFINAVPMCTFLVALATGAEKFHVRRVAGWAKVVGCIFCIAGATTICLYQGPGVQHSLPGSQNVMYQFSGSRWQLGVAVLTVASFMHGFYLILLEPIVTQNPGSLLTVTAVAYIYAACLFLFGAVVAYGRSPSSWALPWGPSIFCIAYAGVIASGVSFWLQTWCIKKGGPVLAASSFSLQYLFTLAQAVAVLGDPFCTGSLIGAIVLVTGVGLIAVKFKEDRSTSQIPSADIDGASQDDPAPTTHETVTTPLLQRPIARTGSKEETEQVPSLLSEFDFPPLAAGAHQPEGATGLDARWEDLDDLDEALVHGWMDPVHSFMYVDRM